MKTLTLLRHAKAANDGIAARDFDRRLDGAGRRAAQAIGRHLRAEGRTFDAAIASPAIRVAETVEQVAIGYGAAIAPIWERRIYLASAAELIELVRETPDTAAGLLLIGHNPGIAELAAALAPDAEIGSDFPTAGLAEIVLGIAHWGDIAPGTGRLSRFVQPDDLDRA